MKFKYSEDKFLKELEEHIKNTYLSHYSGGIQTTEFIMSNATTLDYLKGNIIKYVQRYGKKKGYNKEDLYKMIHYIMMMSHYSTNKEMNNKEIQMKIDNEDSTS